LLLAAHTVDPELTIFASRRGHTPLDDVVTVTVTGRGVDGIELFGFETLPTQAPHWAALTNLPTQIASSEAFKGLQRVSKTWVNDRLVRVEVETIDIATTRVAARHLLAVGYRNGVAVAALRYSSHPLNRFTLAAEDVLRG
jgi:hypothetical protein